MTEYYEIMSERINEFKQSPLPKDWDGVMATSNKWL